MASQSCYSLTSYDIGCKLQEAGAGLKRRIYIGLVSDLDEETPFSYNGNGDVSSINFQSYCGFVKFTGLKDGNNGTVDIQRTEDGNPFYPMNVVLRLFDITTDDKTFLSNIAISEDIFAVVETNSGRCEVIGGTEGLTVESAPRSFGQTPQDSSARILTLSGDQTAIEKIFAPGPAYSDNVAALESYVI